MHDISPVLTDSVPRPDTGASVNFTSGSAAPDGSTQAVRKTTDAGSTTDFSFSDFLDLINPLQHIPVVSSVYREITGDKINPVSRVAGDILYGGLFGAASAITGGVGAAADGVVEAETGKDGIGTVVAALFEDDTKASATNTVADSAPTQLAAADAPSVSMATVTPPVSAPAEVAAAPTTATVSTTAPMPSDNTSAQAPADKPAVVAKGFPLNRDKMAFGGVMRPVASLTRQDHVDALNRTLRAQHIGGTILPSTPLTSPAVTQQASQPIPDISASASPLPRFNQTLPSVTSPIPPISATAESLAPAQVNIPRTALIPPELSNDAIILKALGQYTGTANNTVAAPSKGAALDIMN